MRLEAAPVDGDANAALLTLLARVLGVRPRALTLVAGSTARTKVVDVTGVRIAAVRSVLESVRQA